MLHTRTPTAVLCVTGFAHPPASLHAHIHTVTDDGGPAGARARECVCVSVTHFFGSGSMISGSTVDRSNCSCMTHSSIRRLSVLCARTHTHTHTHTCIHRGYVCAYNAGSRTVRCGFVCSAVNATRAKQQCALRLCLPASTASSCSQGIFLCVSLFLSLYLSLCVCVCRDSHPM